MSKIEGCSNRKNSSIQMKCIEVMNWNHICGKNSRQIIPIVLYFNTNNEQESLAIVKQL